MMSIFYIKSGAFFMRKILFIVAFIFLFTNFAECQEISALSLEECLTLALTNHPSLRKTKAATQDLIAQLESLRANNRVKVNLSGSAGARGNFQYWDNNTDSGNLSLTASKILYDTGQNKLLKEIRQESILASTETEKYQQITVAANAKKAYYDLVLKILNRDVEREKVASLEEQLRNAQGFYDVGEKALIDVTKAKSDLAAARVSLMRAENDILVSQENLRVAMGTDIEGVFNISLSSELLLPEILDNTNELIDIALQDRPDYKKLLHDVKGGELSIKSAARSNSATITTSAGATWSKSEGNNPTREYTVNLNLNVPIVDGGTTKAAIESARARLDSTLADVDSAKQQIIQSVRTSVLNLKSAINTVKSSEEAVKYSEENLTLARGRYEVGVGDSLEVSNAVSSLASARYTYYQALYNAQAARVDLDSALGHLPGEIEGKI